MKKGLALFAILVLVVSCGGGGGSGGSVDVSRDLLVGMWVMSSTGGQACPSCIILQFYANGVAKGTDLTGGWLGHVGSVKGTWQYAGGVLYLSGGGLSSTSTARMPTINELRLSDGAVTNVYARAQ